jgi:hypothetical protein
MLNSALVHLLSMLNKKIKDESNNDKYNFYTFKILNAQFPKENLYNNLCQLMYYLHCLVFSLFIYKSIYERQRETV